MSFLWRLGDVGDCGVESLEYVLVIGQSSYSRYCSEHLIDEMCLIDRCNSSSSILDS